MRLLRRWLNRIALSAPGIQNLVRRADRAIEAAETIRSASDVERLMGDEIELQLASLRRRMGEALELRAAEVACISPDKARAFHEAHQGPVESPAQFKERLWELELALEDRGWVREITLSNLEFSRYGIQQLTRICRVMALKNPIVKRTAILCRLYVFGRGVEIHSDDDPTDAIIQNFLERNKAELGHVGLASKEQDIQTDGSNYHALPTDAKGNVGYVKIDPLEIMETVCDPDNPSMPWYYYRMWNRLELDQQNGVVGNTPMKCWYPSLELVEGLDDGTIAPQVQRPDGSMIEVLLDNIGGTKVNWQMPILRDRDAETPSSWRWAVPPLYALLDWARAYKDFLEDWATIQRSLSRFALMVETKGGQAAIAAYQSLLSTTFADSGGTQIERNPPPVRGSAHISGPDNKITPFKSAGTQVSPEQARRLLLMGAAAAGMPETFYGDASTGSLATAVSLDRPTELKFTEIQRRWTYVLKRILSYVASVSGSSPGGKLREAAKQKKPIEIKIKFPNVIEHDVLPMIQSITEIATGGGRQGIFAGVLDRRTYLDLCLAEIGYEDRQELLDQIFGQKYDAADDVTDQRSQPAPQSISVPLGKALTDLSIPPPLPPPPAPIAGAIGGFPPKPGAPPNPKPALPAPAPAPKKGKVTKEALLARIATLVEHVGRE